jgi:tryptophanyl-tRNA synthetase
MRRVFSGIQPTGDKHLGNYLGAIRHFPTAQHDGEALFCIVDLHALTVQRDPAELRRKTYDTAAIILAAGVDPTRSVVYRQADVAAHSELAYLLSALASVGELLRMHQFRDKSRAQRDLVSAALLFYPVLMAADILVFRATDVPVGEDQREHLELARDVVRRFAARYGDGVLVMPERRTPATAARVKDLQDPARAMSTTRSGEDGAIQILDPPDVIRRKLRRAVTDSGREIRPGPDKPGVTNLLEITAALRGEPVAGVAGSLDGAGYGALKDAAAEAVIAALAPLQARYRELRADEPALERLLADGAGRAAAMAAPTLADVRARMGAGRPRAPYDGSP